MKRIIIFLIAVISIGCGTQQQQKQFDVSGFESYYNGFCNAGQIQTDNIVIKFGTLGEAGAEGGTIVGQCQYGATPVVTIDPEYWDNVSEGQRTELIWHELGHCILNRTQHNNALLPDGTPASIMNQYVFSWTIVNNNYEYYRHEMFGK